MLAPEPQLSACLRIIHIAAVKARAIGWTNGDVKQVADLMEAVHELPLLLQQWETVDEKQLIEMLDYYDRKWGDSLRAEYERLIGG